MRTPLYHLILLCVMLQPGFSLRAELTTAVLDALRQYVPDNQDGAASGAQEFLEEKKPDRETRLAVFHWLANRPAKLSESRTANLEMAIDQLAYLGDIEGAEQYLPALAAAYQAGDYMKSGEIGVRHARDYLPISDLRLRAHIEESRSYCGGGQKDYSAARGYYCKFREILLLKADGIPNEETRASTEVYAYFTHFETCGMYYELDGNVKEAERSYNQAILNYSERQLSKTPIAGSLRESVSKRCNIMKDKVSLWENRITDPTQRYLTEVKIIEFHALLTRYDMRIADLRLKGFVRSYEKEDFLIDGPVGPMPAREYSATDALRLKALIAETQTRSLEAPNYSEALMLWKEYRKSLAARTGSIEDQTKRNKNIVYTDFLFSEHCGRLESEDGDLEQAQKSLEEAVSGYENSVKPLALDEDEKTELQNRLVYVKAQKEKNNSILKRRR
jgi:hypothetical protein